jgi:rubrerythrin
MSPKEVTKLDITNEVFKEPIEVIKQLSSNLGLNYTKVIQTYVLEDRRLDLTLEDQGSSYFRGKIVWIGNKKDDTEGTIFCVDTKNELKQINPTAENTEKATLDIKKDLLRISTASKTKCSVCGKNIEIFDEVKGCPICEAKAHKDHLTDWVRMKHTCPVCKKSLNVSSTGVIFID